MFFVICIWTPEIDILLHLYTRRNRSWSSQAFRCNAGTFHFDNNSNYSTKINIFFEIWEPKLFLDDNPQVGYFKMYFRIFFTCRRNNLLSLEQSTHNTNFIFLNMFKFHLREFLHIISKCPPCSFLLYFLLVRL